MLSLIFFPDIVKHMANCRIYMCLSTYGAAWGEVADIEDIVQAHYIRADNELFYIILR